MTTIKTEKNTKESFNNKGIIYDKQGEYQKAIDDFTKAIDLDNQYTEAFNNRGVSYSKQGEYQKAIDDFTKAIDLDNQYTKAFYNRGVSYSKQGEYQKAIDDFTKAISIDKEYEYPYLSLINIYENFRTEINDPNIEKKAKKIYIEYQNLLQDHDFNKYLEKILKEMQNQEFKKDLNDLYQIVKNIKSTIKYKGEDDLGHYTKIQNLKWLVKRTTQSTENSYLRLNNIEYMNDPDEGNTFINLLSCNQECKDLLNKIYNLSTNNLEERSEIKSEGNIFLSSLSKNIDNSLPMWRQYANDGDGCCLVFNPNFFEEDLELDSILKSNADTGSLPRNIKVDGLYNVIYIDNNKVLANDEVKEAISSIDNILKGIYDKINNDDEVHNYNEVFKVIREILDTVRFLFKDSTYSYEEEIRLIKFEDIEDESNKNVKCTSEIEGFPIPRLYVNFKKDIRLKEIILGPKVSTEKGIANYIRYTGKSDKITKSKIRYQ